MSSNAVDRLARAYGIEEEFVDARGAVRRTSEETKRALLAALGAPVAGDVEAERVLEERERAEWRAALPPVVVTTEAQRPRVPLTLDAQTARVVWTIALEDGGERRGAAGVAELPEREARTVDGRPRVRRDVPLDVDLPRGYHRLTLEGAEGETRLIVTPGRCHVPAGLERRKAWGVAAQLYLLRSERNWGIGDFGDLRRFVELVADAGGDIVGLNPLHALFLDDPEHASPYSPASRHLLNALNVDVTAIPEYAACTPARALVDSDAFREELARCRAAALVPYAAVAETKVAALRLVFAHGKRTESRERALARFIAEGGETLRRSCVFQALHAHFAELDWRRWPPEYRDAASAAVESFARAHADDVAFLLWLQWIADEQLGAAAAAGAQMRVGLYRDLAVGADAGGAETWSDPHAVVHAATIGAPPDVYNPQGQDWGLPPFHPLALRADGYRSFVRLVRANMRHAGALRIDHAMALQHLYLIPRGSSPADGAYVAYPLDDLLGILALESARAECLVIGEDLGTVPEGFRERTAAANVLSYRVLFFEQDPESGEFLAPERYPLLALAVAGSHDLPSLRAWWNGYDLDLKAELGLFPGDEEARRQREMRERARTALVAALRREGLLPPDGPVRAADLLEPVHAFLARTNALLAMAQLDDVTGELEPVNVPTTSDEEHPNWRRRQSTTLERLAAERRLARAGAAFAREGRGRTVARTGAGPAPQSNGPPG